MAFGQASGPPASARQVAQLLALLQAAGHTDFRDARGPMRFTQRQGAGKFTVEEATELIDQLEAAAHEGDASAVAAPVAAAAPRLTMLERTLRGAPADQLAAELERRGWTVTKP